MNRKQRKLKFIRLKNEITKRAGTKVNIDKTFKFVGYIPTNNKNITVYQCRGRITIYHHQSITLTMPFPDATLSGPYTTGFISTIPKPTTCPKEDVSYVSQEE